MFAERNIFQSFLQAGFECSTHKRVCGQRLDLVTSTGHAEFTAEDYLRLHPFGIRTVREAARWHLIERCTGTFDFSSLESMLDAAAATGTEVILDLLHFGWPDSVDPLSDKFAEQFGTFVSATAEYLRSRQERVRFIAPVNEISFLSWAGADVGCINPYLTGRAWEFKRSLVKAAITASAILLDELPGVRLISPEPVIHIVENPELPGSGSEAEMYTLAQYQAWDMLSGRLAPELGGRPEYLDILGANFYDRNEWVHHGECLERSDARYKPFHLVLQDLWNRYHRPLFVSETGTEDGWRAEWFNYICDEVAIALTLEIPVSGICLYPVLSHPGWEDDRHCYNGLFDYPDEAGNRNTHWPLAQALRKQRFRFTRSNSAAHEFNHHRPDLSFSPSLGIRFPTTSAPYEQVRAEG